jgi:hypothetical protein
MHISMLRRNKVLFEVPFWWGSMDELYLKRVTAMPTQSGCSQHPTDTHQFLRIWTRAIGPSPCHFRGNSLFWTILTGLIA